MKSQAKRTASDKLTFHWDRKASRNTSTSGDMQSNYHQKRSLNTYFDFLDEVKPHMEELRQTQVFKKPFTLV